MRTLLGTLGILIWVGTSAIAQQLADKDNFYGPEFQAASFPGGVDSLVHFQKRQVVYPEMARQSNIEGRVIVDATVDEGGNIKDIRVVRGIGGGCDEAAEAVVRKMPLWQPATYKGLPTLSHVAIIFLFQVY